MRDFLVNPLRRLPLVALALFSFFLALTPAVAQMGSPTSTPDTASPADFAVPPMQWAEVAARNEEHMINYDTNALLRYRVHKVDAKGDVIREVIESKEGSVARIVLRNGQPLTPDDNAAERERLQTILNDPETFLRRERREDSSRSYAVELLRTMPRAMLWSYVSGQPQLAGSHSSAIVLDFKPDPHFKPPSLITQGLTGIAGRLWIDRSSQCVLRIQGSILHPVDFGWGGVLARIREGGYVEMQQSRATDRRWLYSHLVERLTVREVLVHTVQENTELNVSDVQPLPTPPSFREAVQQLLALPVPTH